MLCFSFFEKKKSILHQESFYLAVPYLGDNDDEIGELVFYLEEPAGRVNQNASDFHKKLSRATQFMRGFKKKASKFYRDVAKQWGTVLRVACNESSMIVKVSDFDTANNEEYHLQTTISMIGIDGGSRKEQDNVALAKVETSLDDRVEAERIAKTADWVSCNKCLSQTLRSRMHVDRISKIFLFCFK